MATNASRKARGMRTQKVVAEAFKDAGWPHAETAGAGRPGTDVLGIVGVDGEVKARRGFNGGAGRKPARELAPRWQSAHNTRWVSAAKNH